MSGAGVSDFMLQRRVVRDAPMVAPRDPQPDVCDHGRPDHQAMIRQLAEAMGLNLPAIAATPAQVWETLLGEVERAVRTMEDFHSSGTQVGWWQPDRRSLHAQCVRTTDAHRRCVPVFVEAADV